MSLGLVLLLVSVFAGTSQESYADSTVKYEFRDEFDSFNTEYWKVIDRQGPAMDMTELSAGILTLKATETDNYPTLISKEIPIEMGDTLIMKRRVYAHPEHDKFSEGAYITEESDATWNTSRDRDFNFLAFYQHLYFTYDKGRYPEGLTKGNFGHARIDGFSKLNVLKLENYGITTSTLDEWVEEEFIYETATGKVTITSNGETMTFQSRTLSKPYVRFHMSPWGWYTGQYNQLDWIEFKVIGSGGDLEIEDNTNPVIGDEIISTGTNSEVRGKVVDAATGMPISGVNVKLLSRGVEVDRVLTDQNGEYKFSEDTGIYILLFEKNNYINARYNNVENRLSQVDHMQTVKLVVQGTDKGMIEGRVVNAVTGEPIAGASVVVNKNINTPNHSTNWSLITDRNGVYKFDGNAGNYTVVASKNGYIQSHMPLTLVANTNDRLGDLAITPELNDNEMRIILKWGNTSKDLDGHLIVKNSDESSNHIYYNNKKYQDETTSIVLDVDDRSTGGPETITIENPQLDMYEYYVYNYVSYGSASLSGLPNSQAVVEVYMGNQLIQKFNVPAEEGLYWKVFAFNGVSLKPLNVMLDEWR